MGDPHTQAHIGLTLGDPSGVGPDLVAAAIGGAREDLRGRLRVYCDRPILERAFARAGGARLPPDLEVIDRGMLSADQAPPGEPTAAGASAQVAYLEAAAKAARAGEIGAVVTAPISKSQAKRAGLTFPGHTEFFADRLGAGETAMMFAGPSLKVVLATVHVPLREVPAILSEERIVSAGRLGAASLERDFGLRRPRVGVLGLNPHAGEGGLFGREEIDVIEPAVGELRRALPGAEVAGPLPPDTAFRGDFDLFVALYHDQGLTPIKLLDFEDAVNVTLGLPIVRTSPDHGVAYDAAAQNTARPQSFRTALDLAREILDRRQAHTSLETAP